MYIPRGLIWWFAGFMCFPLFAYVICKAKGWDKEDKEKEENEKLEKEKQDK